MIPRHQYSSPKSQPKRKKHKEVILEALKKLHFVLWDRYIENPATISLYGWIMREKDRYKDFILLIYHKDTKNFSWVSSSEYYTEAISAVFNAAERRNCQRVEHLYKELNNVVKL